MTNIRKKALVIIVAVASIAAMAALTSCMLFGGGDNNSNKSEPANNMPANTQNGNYIQFSDSKSNLQATNSLAPVNEHQGKLSNVANIASVMNVNHMPPPPAAKEADTQKISDNISDGQFAVNGVVVTLGKTTLKEFLVDSNLDYARFFDENYANGQGLKVPKNNVEQHLHLNKFPYRTPTKVSVIFDDEDLNFAGRWLNLVIWYPDWEEEEEPAALEDGIIITARANNLQFDAVTNESPYYQLPCGIDSNSKSNGMSTFMDAWGSVAAIPSECVSYIFWDGYFWTWNKGSGAILGIHVDNAEKPTEAYGFEYSIPTSWHLIPKSKDEFDWFVDGFPKEY